MGNIISVVAVFIIPGLIFIVANRRVAEFFTKAGRKDNLEKFTPRASVILGVGWLLGGILMLILRR
jgi:hypothetical protein